MKRRLKNKGMTSIELLVSFVIVAAIVVSLFNVVMNYKTKEQIQSIENSVVEYTNNLEKVIQDDLIKKNVTSVVVANDQKSANFTLQDNTVTHLELDDVNQQIRYGTLDNIITYQLPAITELTLSSKSTIELHENGVSVIKIIIILTHPNLKNESYQTTIIAPINFNA